MSRPAATNQLPWWRGWGVLLLLPVVVFVGSLDGWPRWAFMWTLSGAIYFGCKWLTWRRANTSNTSWWKQAGYLLAWPGMNAAAFFNDANHTTSPSCTRGEWLAAIFKTSVGLALFFGGVRLIPAESPYLTSWVGMVGLIMALHFGVFHLLSCAWRTAGVDAPPLMNRPLLPNNISDFWGRRWNVAFRDLTNRFIFRPLVTRCGPLTALFLGFLASGLIHDLVISVPAGGGYGGPTLFFVLQAFAISVSRSKIGKQLGLKTGWRGWLFAVTTLLGPVELLFHRPFALEIILPFLKAVGAVS